MREFSVENLLFVTEIDFWKAKFVHLCNQSGKTNIEDDTIPTSEQSLEHANVQLDGLSEVALVSNETTRTMSPYDESCCLSGLDYVIVSPIMKEKSFAKSVLLIIDIFIKDDAENQINIAFSQKKRLLQKKIILSILKLRDNDNIERFDESKLAFKDLQIFDEIYHETTENLKDSYRRFVKTIEFTTLLRVASKPVATIASPLACVITK